MAATKTPPPLMSRRTLAERLGVTTRTLAIWVAKGLGPRPIKLGRAVVRYDSAEVDAWIASQRSAA